MFHNHASNDVLPPDEASGVRRRRSKFAEEWPRLDRMLAQLGARLLDAAAIRPGQVILDIGCGAGGTTLDAARRLRGRGRVIGIDVDPDVIEVARERALHADIGNAELICSDAARYPFAPFLADAIVSRFGTMHFADPVAAYARLLNALKPNGVLAFLCWREARRNPWATVVGAAVSGVASSPSNSSLGPFILADERRVRQMLADAGFLDIALQSVDAPVCVGSDVDDALDLVQATELSRLSLGASELHRALATLRAAIAPHASERGVWMPASAWLVTARRPR